MDLTDEMELQALRKRVIVAEKTLTVVLGEVRSAYNNVNGLYINFDWEGEGDGLQFDRYADAESIVLLRACLERAGVKVY